MQVSTQRVWDLMRQSLKCEAIGMELLKEAGLKTDRHQAINLAHRLVTYIRNYPDPALLTIKIRGIIPEIVKAEKIA